MSCPKITISFKVNELDLYDKVKNSSCSPATYIKDLLIKHFKELEAKESEVPKQSRNFIDDFDL